MGKKLEAIRKNYRRVMSLLWMELTLLRWSKYLIADFITYIDVQREFKF
jgi:hypothetical protein